MVENDTIDIISHSEHHFDCTGFLVIFLHTWWTWMSQFLRLLFQFRLICLCSGFIKGSDTVQCVPFIVIPFQMESSIFLPVPLLLFGRVVWGPTWCSFLHSSDVFNGVTDCELAYTNLHS
jgi:hypothetical protein